jgi:uncharacterized protein YodC (DUF2158 family)
MKIKPGDVVQLKSGSQNMTVGKIDEDDMATVHYFGQSSDGDWIYESCHNIHVKALVKVKKEKK